MSRTYYAYMLTFFRAVYLNKGKQAIEAEMANIYTGGTGLGLGRVSG